MPIQSQNRSFIDIEVDQKQALALRSREGLKAEKIAFCQVRDGPMIIGQSVKAINDAAAAVVNARRTKEAEKN